MAERGRFISFEGGEGSGKSTQLKHLNTALDQCGLATVVTREPGGTEGAEAIRQLLVEGEPNRWDPETEMLLHVAARRDHMARLIAPTLVRGDWVLCDRFTDSTMAYQGFGHGLDQNMIRSVQAASLPDIRPDLTIFLDIPVDIGLARAGTRRGDENRYERMDITFHERIRQGFLSIAETEPGRCVLIDATASIEQVTYSVIETVCNRYGLAIPSIVGNAAQ
jgi:dTMP kinase